MDKRSCDKDATDLSCFYVAKQDTFLSRFSGVCNVNVSTLRLGMLVEANEVYPDGGLRIRVNDTNNEDVWQKTEWRCHKIDLIPVPPIVWHFLAAIQAPQERVRIASNVKLCQDVQNLRLGDRIWYRSQPNAQRSLAIIKSIGPVLELGQGFHFGLELVDNRTPSQTSALAKQYIASSSGNLTLATLNEVCPLEHELSDQVKNSDLSDLSNNAKSSSMQSTILPLDFNTALNSTLSTHLTNGKKTQRDLSGAFEERLTIFDDTKNNNNGNTLSRLNNALVPKVAHQSAKSKIVVSESSSLTSRNLESLDFLGNNRYINRNIDTFVWTDIS